MSYENNVNTPEKKDVPAKDNARKFILSAISLEDLKEFRANSFVLAVDWLEMGDGNETKLARKEYDDRTAQTLLINKVTDGGNRATTKKVIGEQEYERRLADSLQRVVKRRSEFKYVQDHVVFDLKYDEFHGSSLRMLEVETLPSENEAPFDPTIFKEELIEVSDDPRYTGYRVAEVL